MTDILLTRTSVAIIVRWIKEVIWAMLLTEE